MRVAMSQDLTAVFQQHAEQIEGLLAAELPPEQLPYLSGSVWYQFDSGGKRIRPALCLIACEAFGGSTQEALHFALATEALHNFFLVHDDIEDGDTMRRDRPTLWTEVGVANAINVGDFLIAKAYQLILKSPVQAATKLELVQIFTETFERTVEGQALDINLRGADVDLQTYYRIVNLKTAFYLALPWVGGAMIAGADPGARDTLLELGRCLGPAFQIRDDLLDLTQGKGRGGEVGCDLKEGKPSILYAQVLEQQLGSDEERDRLRRVMASARDETEAKDVVWAIDFFRRVGALAFAEAEAERLLARAHDLVDSLPISAEKRELFHAISDFVVQRKS